LHTRNPVHHHIVPAINLCRQFDDDCVTIPATSNGAITNGIVLELGHMLLGRHAGGIPVVQRPTLGIT
jgi:hypothetical protein